MKAKKHFGQHFLTHPDTAKKIVDALGDISQRKVVEIGPGLGVITQYMVHQAQEFKAIEIDTDAAQILSQKFPSIQLLNEDFLKADISNLFTTHYSLIGNFPYNISSQIVFKIIDHAALIDQWVGMFQLEMGLRLIATPADKKTYGILSVLLPFYYRLEKVMKLPPGAFNPPPKVHSIVLKATRTEHTWLCDPVLLKKVVKASFGMRRKTLANSLQNIAPKDVILSHPLGSLRPENLGYLQFEELTLYLQNYVGN